jgi:protein-L-isoaspartate(D-aspartate) O-methyltransferase
MFEQDHGASRRRMVTEQMRARGVTDARVLAALERVARHRFVNAGDESLAHEDYPLPIGHGQTISQPYIVALMSELLQLQGHEKVLEIGAGSGYQSAILAELGRTVIAVERLPELADRARNLLAELGYANVEIVVGDGTQGRPEAAPYDAILVTAAAPKVADPWIAQLADGGRLVFPLGARWSQILTRVTRRGAELHTESFGAVAFVPLIGEHGWGE